MNIDIRPRNMPKNEIIRTLIEYWHRGLQFVNGEIDAVANAGGVVANHVAEGRPIRAGRVANHVEHEPENNDGASDAGSSETSFTMNAWHAGDERPESDVHGDEIGEVPMLAMEYRGQPHAQPPLGGYRTPTSQSTGQVLDSDPLEEFMPSENEETHEKENFESDLSITHLDGQLLGGDDKPFKGFIVIPLKKKDIRVCFSYDKKTTSEDVMNLLKDASDYKITKKNAKLMFGLSEPPAYETLMSFFTSGQSFDLCVRVQGGALVRRGFVKKEDRINMLIKRSKAYVSKKIEEKAEVVGTAPMTLQTFIAPMEQKMATFKQKIIAKEVSLKDLMDGLEDAKLHQIIECLDVSKREHTEERLYKIAPMLIEDMALLDASIPRLANLRIEMFELLLEAFAMDYTIEKGTELIYCPDKFLADLHAVENYRRGVRRLSEAPSEGDAVSSGSGCGIMWEEGMFSSKILSAGKFNFWR